MADSDKNQKGDASKADAAQHAVEKFRKRRSFKTRALGEFAPNLTKRLFGVRGMTQMGLVTDWALIVGEKYAKRSQPEKMIYRGSQKSKATLHIRVEGALGMEMSHIQGIIKERINQYFGFEAVAELRFHQKPLRRGQTPRAQVTRQRLISGDSKPLATEAGSIDAVVDALAHDIKTRDQNWREIIGPDMADMFPTASFLIASDPRKKWDIFIQYKETTPPFKGMGRKERLEDLSSELAAPRAFIRERLEEAYGSMAIGKILFNVDWFSERLVV